MSANDIPDPTAATPGESAPEANGDAAVADPRREEYRLWVQCAKLRNWCRDLLGAQGAEGALPDAVVRELTENPPPIPTDEVMEALRSLAFGEPIPASGSWRTGDAAELPQRLADLAAERERLRQHFFTLIDAVHPDEAQLTDEHFQEMEPFTEHPSISDVLAEFDRQSGGDTR